MLSTDKGRATQFRVAGKLHPRQSSLSPDHNTPTHRHVVCSIVARGIFAQAICPGRADGLRKRRRVEGNDRRVGRLAKGVCRRPGYEHVPLARHHRCDGPYRGLNRRAVVVAILAVCFDAVVVGRVGVVRVGRHGVVVRRAPPLAAVVAEPLGRLALAAAEADGPGGVAHARVPLLLVPRGRRDRPRVRGCEGERERGCERSGGTRGGVREGIRTKRRAF